MWLLCGDTKLIHLGEEKHVCPLLSLREGIVSLQSLRNWRKASVAGIE